MANGNLEKFIPRILNDSTLQDQLKNVTDKEVFAATVVRLGHDRGFEFTTADVNEFLVQKGKNPLQELSEAELELVAGGRPPVATSDGCGAAWTTLFGWC